jgi:hypothetical protein
MPSGRGRRVHSFSPSMDGVRVQKPGGLSTRVGRTKARRAHACVKARREERATSWQHSKAVCRLMLVSNTAA